MDMEIRITTVSELRAKGILGEVVIIGEKGICYLVVQDIGLHGVLAKILFKPTAFRKAELKKVFRFPNDAWIKVRSLDPLQRKYPHRYETIRNPHLSPA